MFVCAPGCCAGKDKVRYQTFSVSDGDYSYKKGEAPTVKQEGKERGKVGSGAPGQSGAGKAEVVEGEKDLVDVEWSRLMNSMKLTSLPGELASVSISSSLHSIS